MKTNLKTRGNVVKSTRSPKIQLLCRNTQQEAGEIKVIDEEWEGGGKGGNLNFFAKESKVSSLRQHISPHPISSVSYFQSSAGRVVACVVQQTVLSDSPPSLTAVAATKCPPICWVALPSSRQRGMASRRSSGSCTIQTRQAQEFYVRPARSRVCV